MKKNLFKTLFIATGATMILTSCLGDTESTRSASNVFSYISKTTAGEKTAMSSGIPMTSPELKNEKLLEPGDCAFLDYKINLERASGGVYQADYIRITNGDASGKVFKDHTTDQVQPLIADVDTVITNNDLYFVDFPLHAALFPIDMPAYGYRWYVEYTYADKKNESAALLEVYYDKNKQEDAKKGEVIIDFRLEKEGSSNPGETVNTIPVRGQKVIKFEEMTGVLAHLTENNMLSIKFRYFKKKLSVKEGEIPYEIYITPTVTTIGYSEKQ